MTETHPPGWLPEAEYRAIFRKVTRMCVEVVVADPDRGILLARRQTPPYVGAWHIPGGTVLWGEAVLDAVRRIGLAEIGVPVVPALRGGLLGYIEYPSHHEHGIDSPVGLAFACALEPGGAIDPTCEFFTELPDGLYAEQRSFLDGLGAPFNGL